MGTNEDLFDRISDRYRHETRESSAGYPGPALSAIRAAANERARLDQTIAAAIKTAYEQGASWSMIGAMLGTTRQAAHAKYAQMINA